MTNAPHFGDDYFFKSADLKSTAQVSEPFRLGGTQGGIQIRVWADGTIATSSGKTITVKVETAPAEDGAWAAVVTETFTAKSAAVTGDIFKYIPANGESFLRVTVTGSDGTTGKFNAAPEYLPR